MQTSDNTPQQAPGSSRRGSLPPFLLRTLTGIAFVVVMVGGILGGPLTCGLLFLVVSVLSVWEFTGLVNARSGVHVNRFIATVAAVCLYLGVFGIAAGLSQGAALFVPWLASLCYVLVAELYLQREDPLHNWAYTMLAQLYVALPFALLPFVAFAGNQFYVLTIFVFLWCSDTGAYCVGSLLGRHKLFPRVSPGKTWEGSIGGALVALAASQLVAWFGPAEVLDCGWTVWGLAPGQWAGFALVVVVFGTWGDLVESLMKRRLGVKDSGNILPGHGGMLDRFDSSLLAIPAAAAYLCALSVL